MNYKHALIFYHTITPLHVGCGQSIGVVDLPVIRERSTGYPFIPGSGIRGSLRDVFETKWLSEKEKIEEKKKAWQALTSTLFGPESEREAAEHAGCLAIHDARLLFYPVRSDREVFLWITCPLVLDRMNRDNAAFKTGFPSFEQDGLSTISDDRFIGTFPGYLNLEEFRFALADNAAAIADNLMKFAEEVAKKVDLPLGSRVVLVSNSSFYYFVTFATILMQHNALTSAKTVKEGALFSIESLPPETILYGMIGATRQRKPFNQEKNEKEIEPTAALTSVKTVLTGNAVAGKPGYLHLGGKESIGMGVTRLSWATDILDKSLEEIKK